MAGRVWDVKFFVLEFCVVNGLFWFFCILGEGEEFEF